LIWLASENTPGVQSRAPDPIAASGAPLAGTSISPAKSTGNAAGDRDTEASEISQLRSDLKAATVARDAAIRDLDKLRGSSENRTRQASQSASSWPLDGTEPKSALTITELPSAPKLPALAIASSTRIEQPAKRQLAGFWFYAKPKEGQKNKNQTLYLPEFIQATITEDGGVVHGHYRSRFQIVDRAISPDVDFTFTGTPNGAQFNCLWSGAGGAKGELTLRLTSENSMRIDWTASELGTLQALSSGTAILTRRIE
jgi:hypothetical protein